MLRGGRKQGRLLGRKEGAIERGRGDGGVEGRKEGWGRREGGRRAEDAHAMQKYDSRVRSCLDIFIRAVSSVLWSFRFHNSTVEAFVLKIVNGCI